MVINAEFAQSRRFLSHLHRFRVGHVNILVALALARAIVAGPRPEVEQLLARLVRLGVHLRSGAVRQRLICTKSNQPIG